MWTRFRFWCRGLQGRVRERIREYQRRGDIINRIADAYFGGKAYVVLNSKEELDIALEIVRVLKIWESWSHDGVFYIIKFDRQEK